MGWGISFNANIKLQAEKFDDVSEIEDRIEESSEHLQDIKERILMHSISGVAAAKKIGDDKCTLDAVDYIHDEMVKLLDDFKNTTTLIYNLKLLKHNFSSIRKS